MDKVKVIRFTREFDDPITRLMEFLLERLEASRSLRERRVIQYIEACILDWEAKGQLSDRQVETLVVVYTHLKNRRSRRAANG
jgi:hypothetical protein